MSLQDGWPPPADGLPQKQLPLVRQLEESERLWHVDVRSRGGDDRHHRSSFATAPGHLRQRPDTGRLTVTAWAPQALPTQHSDKRNVLATHGEQYRRRRCYHRRLSREYRP